MSFPVQKVRSAQLARACTRLTRPPVGRCVVAVRIGAKRFRREDCTLTGAEGRKLECSWFLPAGAASVLPCCVFLHGNSGCRLDAYDAVRVLLPMNVSVFCLDFGGSGRSEGDFVSLGVRESLDTEAVVAHLRASGRVSRIALWGRSMGAATALLYASRDPSIAALVLDSPFASLVRLMAELVHTLPLRFSVPSLLVRGAVAVLRHNIRRRAGFDIHALDVVAASRRCFVPALFAHGREDTFVPPAHSEALAASYSGQSSRVLFDGGRASSGRPALFACIDVCLSSQTTRRARNGCWTRCASFSTTRFCRRRRRQTPRRRRRRPRPRAARPPVLPRRRLHPRRPRAARRAANRLTNC